MNKTEEIISQLTLALLDPEYDGGCPCVSGTLFGIPINVSCWRGSGCGVGIHIGTESGRYTSNYEATGSELAAFVAALVRAGWPSMHCHVDYDGRDGEIIGDCY